MSQSSPKLELFYFEACPFCQMVLNAIRELNVKVEYRDISVSRQDLERLVHDTGRKTVPCLYIDGRPMHESADIVDWLKANNQHLEHD